jgi:hypothetical protein
MTRRAARRDWDGGTANPHHELHPPLLSSPWTARSACRNLCLLHAYSIAFHRSLPEFVRSPSLDHPPAGLGEQRNLRPSPRAPRGLVR